MGVAPEIAFAFPAGPASIDELVIAGWTGRDQAAVERHIEELAAIGVARPPRIPCFYRLGANLLTTSAAIDVVGTASSGEVEVVLLALAEGLFVGVGSDHTDRAIEAVSVTAAKQMCPKPIGAALWRFEDVEPHWDELLLRSWVTRAGDRRLYQEGAAAKMRPPRDLMSLYLGSTRLLPVGTAMYCGTLAVNGELGGGERFEIELHDPKLGRTLQHAYTVRHLERAD
jgi:hypothetical protein